MFFFVVVLFSSRVFALCSQVRGWIVIFFLVINSSSSIFGCCCRFHSSVFAVPFNFSDSVLVHFFSFLRVLLGCFFISLFARSDHVRRSLDISIIVGHSTDWPRTPIRGRGVDREQFSPEKKWLKKEKNNKEKRDEKNKKEEPFHERDTGRFQTTLLLFERIKRKRKRMVP